MTPLPPSASASDPSANDTCLRAQRAIVEDGLSGLAAGIEAHVRDCSECQFLRDLSRDVSGGGWSSATADDPLAAFLETLGRALASGDLILSRYRIVEQVGRGGQGVVFRALDTETGETVALKLVRGHESVPQAGSQEVAHAHRVRHPGVCRVYHTERHGDIRLIVMEYVEGGHLAGRVKGLSQAERRAVFSGICAAVHGAHEAGVLHLDLKPQNVLLRGVEPLVTDFGLSVSVRPDAPAISQGGTAAYMAPEQRDGKPVDRRTDVYALGKMLLFLFPDPPRRIRRIIRRATETDPSRRYSDAAALSADFDRGRRWPLLRWSWAALPGLLALVLFVAFLPPPRGHRARWYEQHWGPDPIPADAWNVALNQTAAPLPAIETDIRPNGCARNIHELIDGAAQYHDWMHGFCFPGPRSMCVSLDVLGFCGALRPEASLCMMRDAPRRSELLPLTVAQREQVAVKPGETLGQLEPGRSCEEDYTMTVTLDRPSVVFAVRFWFVEGVPRWVKIEAEGTDGAWQTLIVNSEQTQQLDGLSPNIKNDIGFGSAPVTVDCMPFRTKRLRVSTRCSKTHPFDPSQVGHNVWLYELEVFARVSRLDAWRRHLWQ